MKPPLVLISLGLLVSACVSSTQLPPTDTLDPSPTVSPSPTKDWFPVTKPPVSTLPIVTPTSENPVEHGKLILKDVFPDISTWSTETQGRGKVYPSLSGIALTVDIPGVYLSSVRSDPTLGDFYTEISAHPQLCKLDDEYGILFRVSPENGYYRFALSCDGRTRVDRILNNRAYSIQPWMLSGDVPPGSPSTIRLGVWALGKELKFYIGGRHQFTLIDTYLSKGMLGVFARSSSGSSVTVRFTDLEVWEILP